MQQEFDVEALVEAHQAAIWRYLRVLGCDPSLADDLVQDTFVAVLSRPFDASNPAAARAYLRVAAKNLFLMALRRRDRRAEADHCGDADEQWAIFTPGGDGGEAMLDALRECLGILDQRERHALDLRYRDKLGREDMASALSLAENGVKTLLQRTRERLRRCIERKLSGSDQ